MNSSRSISDEWFNSICLSSLLLGIFIMKTWVEFSLTSLGNLKYNYVIKTNINVPLINSSVVTGLNFFLLIISAITSSKTINILPFLPIIYSPIFL